MRDLTKKKATPVATAKELTARYRIKKAVKGYVPGEVVLIKVNSDGVPKKKYWRRRLEDSRLDGCIELVTTKRKKSKPKADEV